MSAKKMVVPDKIKERDLDFVNAEIALKRAARKARIKAFHEGVGVIVIRDGRITEERPDSTI